MYVLLYSMYNSHVSVYCIHVRTYVHIYACIMYLSMCVFIGFG